MGLKILLVDDDHFVAEPTKLILEMFGYDVKLFSSSIEALDHFSQDIDILFVDFHLADLNGLELCKKIKSLKENVLTVFYSGDLNNTELKSYVVEASNNAVFLSKPASIDQISTALSTITNRLVCA